MRNEIVDRLLGEPLCNLCQSFFDGFVEKNVEHRHKMGLKKILIRQMVADCCDWCRNLAGVYDYNNAPDDIYRRHDNCRCMVTFKSEKSGYQDVHSKQEAGRYKQLRLLKIKELELEDEIRLSWKRQRMVAKERGVPYDATEEWLYNSRNKQGRISRATKYPTPEGDSVVLTRENSYFDFTDREYEVGELFAKTFGVEVEMAPKFRGNEAGRRSADYLISRERWDLKEPEFNSIDCIRNNAKKHRGKIQAENFIFGVPKYYSDEDAEKVFEQARDAMTKSNMKHVKRIAIIRGTSILKIYEKI